jgi:hypothetical protein
MARKKKSKSKPGEDDSKREAILDERQNLKRLFSAKYSPEIGVFRDEKVEVMLKLTYSQAEKLATLLKETEI